MLPPAMLTGTLALTAFCSAVAHDAASGAVRAPCRDSWAWPEPPQPMKQLEPADWFWLLFCSVPAALPAPLFAALSAFCAAVLAPPAMLTGTLALTAFCEPSALENAPWSVAAPWPDSWAWPEPPQPMKQLELADWFWLLFCSVPAALPAPLFAALSAFCAAVLAPPTMFPPAMLTGTLALTAFCEPSALEAASWPVSAC